MNEKELLNIIAQQGAINTTSIIKPGMTEEQAQAARYRKIRAGEAFDIEQDKQESALPPWWPKSEIIKTKWKVDYIKKIKPLFDKDKNISKIAKSLQMSRTRVRRILIWASKDISAYK